VTSLFSRLQKLNKQATKEPWNWIPGDEGPGFRFGGEHWMDEAGYAHDDVDADLIVECRNSLPAVLNLIEAAQRTADQIAESHEDDVTLRPVAQELRQALATLTEEEANA
jgi:hypothetical protein